MHSTPTNRVRRGFIVRATQIAGLAALTTATLRAPPADAKAAKSEFMYQDHGHDGKSCSQCKFFSPDNGNPDVGSCSVVEGTISRQGWCTAFALKLFA